MSVTAKVLGQGNGTLSSLYTVPAGLQAQCVVYVCNRGATQHTYSVSVIPASGAATNSEIVSGAAIDPSTSEKIDGICLSAGDRIGVTGDAEVVFTAMGLETV